MKNWLIAGLAIVVILLVLLNIDSCNKRIDLQADYNTIKGYPDTIMYYKDKNGELQEFNKSLEVSEESLLAAVDGLNSEVKRLKIKALRNVTNVTTEARIDTIRIGFREPLPCDSFDVPFTDTLSPYYKIQGRVTNDNIMLNRISIPDSQQIIVGTKKNGLFKQNEFIVTITHSNPHVKTTGLQNYTIKKQQKKFSIGPSLTYGLSIPDLKPMLVGGISLQYKFIRF